MVVSILRDDIQFRPIFMYLSYNISSSTRDMTNVTTQSNTYFGRGGGGGGGGDLVIIIGLGPITKDSFEVNYWYNTVMYLTITQHLCPPMAHPLRRDKGCPLCIYVKPNIFVSNYYNARNTVLHSTMIYQQFLLLRMNMAIAVDKAQNILSWKLFFLRCKNGLSKWQNLSDTHKL